MREDGRIDPEMIAARIDAPTARELASTIAQLIRDEALLPGDQLPRVRDLARVLRISPSTVSAAWTQLRERGLVEGRGKAGTSVRPNEGSGPDFTETTTGYDLRYVFPDPILLPRLDAALQHAVRQPGLSEYDRAQISPLLRDQVMADWPYPCEDMIAASGATDGMWLVLRALTVPGDRVLIEAPGPPPLVRVTRSLGLIPVEVDSDRHGPTPASVRQGLKTDPVVLIYQPRSQVPTGRVVTPERLAELSAIVRPTRLSVIEFDDLSDLSIVEPRSMGAHLPERVTVVKAYEKSHGPDLRMAVIGGTAHLISGIHGHMLMERQWTSRILQGALAWLLGDQGVRAGIAAARQTYHQRLTTLANALREGGIDIDPVDGLCCWVPVADEDAAARYAADRGVLVHPGVSSFPSGRRGFIRLAVSRLTTDQKSIARIVREAASAG